MAKEGLEKYNAAGPTLGYLYQIRLALLWALRQAKKSDFVVAVEALDDVSFALDSDPFVVLQTKHSTQHAAGLGDYTGMDLSGRRFPRVRVLSSAAGHVAPSVDGDGRGEPQRSCRL